MQTCLTSQQEQEQEQRRRRRRRRQEHDEDDGEEEEKEVEEEEKEEEDAAYQQCRDAADVEGAENVCDKEVLRLVTETWGGVMSM